MTLFNPQILVGGPPRLSGNVLENYAEYARPNLQPKNGKSGKATLRAKHAVHILRTVLSEQRIDELLDLRYV